ncbi:MAG: ABC transporter ATP-binding protein [Armatimonadetes bacterium]|nr:ABC transporter ATP-binding protein [Armatimonadota bacterium]
MRSVKNHEQPLTSVFTSLLAGLRPRAPNAHVGAANGAAAKRCPSADGDPTQPSRTSRYGYQVRYSGVSKRYGDVQAIHHLNLNVRAGEIVALVGPSGCGKTTTLRVLAGHEVPDAGEIEIGGQIVNGSRWVAPESRGVGMVFQDYALFPHLTIADNVAFGLRRWGREQRSARVRAALALVDLADVAERSPHQLSGGQQQRVALARALAPNPNVILLDEPLSNLDTELRAQMRAELRRILKDAGMTAVFVTHDQEEAFAVADRIGVLSRGRLWQIGSPEEVYHAPACRFVADFIGEADFLPGEVRGGCVHTELGVVHCGGLPEGAGVEVMVRPSELKLRPSHDGAAVVRARRFRGSEHVYEVALSSGTLVHCLGQGQEPLPAGARVELSVATGNPVIFVTGDETRAFRGRL